LGRLDSGLFANNQADSRSFGGRWQLQNRYIDGDWQLEHADSSSQSQTRYTTNFRFSTATAGGRLSWGSTSNQNAAVLIDLRQQAKGAKFQVLVDERPAGIARGGETTLIPLAPYTSYTLRLQHRGEELLHFEQDSQTVTLYPGNIVPLTWEAQPIQVIIGQATDSNGTPLSLWRITNVSGLASSDETGWFQVEIPQDITRLEFSRADRRCLLELPQRSVTEELIVYDEALPCQGVE